MPRPIWSGSLSFGLVNVPVKLMSATKDLGNPPKQRHVRRDARLLARRHIVAAKCLRQVAERRRMLLDERRNCDQSITCGVRRILMAVGCSQHRT